jgi:MYXO-CTERM domain-containing protein
MKPSLLLRRAVGSLLLALVLGTVAHAQTVLDVTSALVLGDPTQTGRLSRNAVPQDWANDEPFPGVINTTITYHYHTYIIDAATMALGPFAQITFDSTSANTFVSAYYTSYLPDSAGTPNFGFDTHWLGDAGTSGNFFGTDPVFFQVVVPTGMSLVVVVNNTSSANVGVGDPFNLLVESFSSTEYDPPLTPTVTPPPLTAVPEPSTYGVAGAVMLAGLAVWRRRRNARAA